MKVSLTIEVFCLFHTGCISQLLRLFLKKKFKKIKKTQIGSKVRIHKNLYGGKLSQKDQMTVSLSSVKPQVAGNSTGCARSPPTP